MPLVHCDPKMLKLFDEDCINPVDHVRGVRVTERNEGTVDRDVVDMNRHKDAVGSMATDELSL
jgi:hypothetical protein